MSAQRSIYLAGELFSSKHLAGNAALAGHIERVSEGRFCCVLPQDLPQSASPRTIRDQDLRALELARCVAPPAQQSGKLITFRLAEFYAVSYIHLSLLGVGPSDESSNENSW